MKTIEGTRRLRLGIRFPSRVRTEGGLTGGFFAIKKVVLGFTQKTTTYPKRSLAYQRRLNLVRSRSFSIKTGSKALDCPGICFAPKLTIHNGEMALSARSYIRIICYQPASFTSYYRGTCVARLANARLGIAVCVHKELYWNAKGYDLLSLLTFIHGVGANWKWTLFTDYLLWQLTVRMASRLWIDASQSLRKWL